MKNVWWVIGGIGVLIGLYLVATNASPINGLVTTLADASLKGVATLQGRPVKGVTY